MDAPAQDGAPFQGFTVASLLAHRATGDPSRDFLRYGDDLFTLGQVESRAEALAASLHGLGVEGGDRVALILPPWPEFVISMFAVAKLGAVLVPLNPHLTKQELRYMLRHSGATAAIIAESVDGVDHLQIFEEMMDNLPGLNHLVTVGEEDLWYDDRIYQFEDLLAVGGGRDYSAPAMDPASDLFAIVYTSGTTGGSKGVELTHANLLHTAAATAEAAAMTPEDRVIGVIALFHVFGLGPGILGTLLSGATLVLQDEFSAKRTLDLIEEHRITVHYGVPTLFATELQELQSGSWDTSSVRIGVSAGGSIHEEAIDGIREKLCPRFLLAYSLTEAASTVTIVRTDDPRDKSRFTVGRPIPGTHIRILERDRRELPVESVGEIAIRGTGVMRGYYRQPGETSRSFEEEGYLLTGDLGLLDEEGYLHLVGRRKEVIIRSGFSVYPREVEDCLRTHPAVRLAAAVGVPDDVLGEAIWACIVPVEGAITSDREIRDWCRVTLADYKVPDQVRFLDEFPMTGTGKVRRLELARIVSETRPEDRT